MTPYARHPMDPWSIRRVRSRNPTRPASRAGSCSGSPSFTIGVLFLLDAFDVPGIGDLWHYVGRLWPSIFLLIGITKLSNSRSTGGRVGGAIWLVVGALMLANNFDVISINVWQAVLAGGRDRARHQHPGPHGNVEVHRAHRLSPPP